MIILPQIDQTNRRVVPSPSNTTVPVSELQATGTVGLPLIPRHESCESVLSSHSSALMSSLVPKLWLPSIRCEASVYEGETVTDTPRLLAHSGTRTIARVREHFQTPEKIGQIRIRSVELRDIRYFANEKPVSLIDSSAHGESAYVEELSLLQKMREIRYRGELDRDLVANFFRLFLLSESVRDVWIIEPVYLKVAANLVEDYFSIISVIPLNDSIRVSPLISF